MWQFYYLFDLQVPSRIIKLSGKINYVFANLDIIQFENELSARFNNFVEPAKLK